MLNLQSQCNATKYLVEPKGTCTREPWLQSLALYHSCVCILGHADPQNWFDPGVENYCIPLFVVKISFGESYYIF